MKRLMFALCGLCMTALLTAPARAADGYTYTVRVFAGAQGSIQGQEMVVYSDLRYGAQFTFDPKAVEVKDNGKYYCKGLRESGSDNNGALSMLSFPVTEDCDYVVAYGIKGETVAYTVNYLDANGNALAPSETFYGNAGDRPVVAFQYIEGYQPQAYNLTGTLSGNETENVFSFVYTPVPAAAQPSAAPTNTANTAGTAAPGTVGENNEVPEEPTAETMGEDVDNIEATSPPVEIITPAPVPEAERPENLEEVNENQVPMGLLVDAKEFAKLLNDLPAAGKAGIVSGMALLLGGLWWLLFHRKRRRAYE